MYIIRSRWKNSKRRGSISQTVEPQQAIQMNTVDFRELSTLALIDIFSSEADILLAPMLTVEYSYQFLHQSMIRRFNDYLNLLLTNGRPEFKATFKSKVCLFYRRHRISRRYRRNEQSYIGSSLQPNGAQRMPRLAELSSLSFTNIPRYGIIAL